ncbi:MAG: hypothetical protein M3R00_03005, partial [Pseudomonadota bacterium]|nr:hypothetical protein [Pseudomonadota bacterium]
MNEQNENTLFRFTEVLTDHEYSTVDADLSLQQAYSEWTRPYPVIYGLAPRQVQLALRKEGENNNNDVQMRFKRLQQQLAILWQGRVIDPQIFSALFLHTQRAGLNGLVESRVLDQLPVQYIAKDGILARKKALQFQKIVNRNQTEVPVAMTDVEISHIEDFPITLTDIAACEEIIIKPQGNSLVIERSIPIYKIAATQDGNKVIITRQDGKPFLTVRQISTIAPGPVIKPAEIHIEIDNDTIDLLQLSTKDYGDKKTIANGQTQPFEVFDNTEPDYFPVVVTQDFQQHKLDHLRSFTRIVLHNDNGRTAVEFHNPISKSWETVNASKIDGLGAAIADIDFNGELPDQKTKAIQKIMIKYHEENLKQLAIKKKLNDVKPQTDREKYYRLCQQKTELTSALQDLQRLTNEFANFVDQDPEESMLGQGEIFGYAAYQLWR